MGRRIHFLLLSLFLSLLFAVTYGAQATYNMHPLTNLNGDLSDLYSKLEGQSMVHDAWVPTHIAKITKVGKNGVARQYQFLAKDHGNNVWSLDLSPAIEHFQGQSGITEIPNAVYQDFRAYVTFPDTPAPQHVKEGTALFLKGIKQNKGFKYNLEHLVGPWIGALGRMVRVGVIERRINKLGGGLQKTITVHDGVGGQQNHIVNFVGGNAMPTLQNPPKKKLKWPANPQALAQAQADQLAHKAQKALNKINQQNLEAAKAAAKQQELDAAVAAEEALQQKIADKAARKQARKEQEKKALLDKETEQEQNRAESSKKKSKPKPGCWQGIKRFFSNLFKSKPNTNSKKKNK